MKLVFAALTLVVISSVFCLETRADVSYADIFLAGRGYKPVEDPWPMESAVASYSENILDNQPYKEWCTKNFRNGDQIYEAYKEIAFNIDYRAEPEKTDYWQTPVETRQKKQGDCEDSVFLFFSKLSELDIDGDLVWGWVVDKNNSIAFAHAWYQLFDKQGRQYIVEGFSKEWNGIIPSEMIGDKEERVPTLILRHNQVNHIVDEVIPHFDHKNLQDFQETLEGELFPWGLYMNNNTIIKEIFYKLQDMFSRYREQSHQFF